jgi:competence protein ComEA
MPDKVDLNAASAAELSEIAEIEESLANRIVEHRGQFGEFGSLEELAQVEGMDASAVERVRDRFIIEDAEGNAVS